MANLGNITWCKKNLKNDWKSHLFALDESSLIIGRVEAMGIVFLINTGNSPVNKDFPDFNSYLSHYFLYCFTDFTEFSLVHTFHVLGNWFYNCFCYFPGTITFEKISLTISFFRFFHTWRILFYSIYSSYLLLHWWFPRRLTHHWSLHMEFNRSTCG